MSYTTVSLRTEVRDELLFIKNKLENKYGGTFTHSNTIEKALKVLCEKEGIEYDKQ